MQLNKNAFETAEESGRKLLLDLLEAKGITEVQFPKDQYSAFDAVCSDWTHNYLVEVKHRRCTHTAYKDFMLEIKKYKSLNFIASHLQTAMGFKNVRVLYVNFFSDNYYAIWDITNLNGIDTTELYCPKTTAEQQFSVVKETLMLKLEDALDYGMLVNGFITKSGFQKLTLKG